MTKNVAARQTNNLRQEPVGHGLVQLSHGTVGNLACKCSPEDNADFLIKKDRIVCSSCGREVLCLPPLIGIYKATCFCCISSSIKSTFILDARGIYVCTWCGQTK
jgi:hypothetical protein